MSALQGSAEQDVRGTLAQRLALGVPLILLGGAYLSQYGFGLFPCEMCWWQRYPHFAAVALALVSFVARPRELWVALAGLAILTSGIIGVYHAGVEYGFWEGLTACTSSVTSGGGDALEAIMRAPLVRCDVAPWTFAGVSLAGFNAAISISAAVAILVLVLKGKRA
jgi:disulfide bond formation protein DsbB